MDFATLIKLRRKELGLTMDDLEQASERAGRRIPAPTWTRWTKTYGRRPAVPDTNIDTIEAAAEALQVHPEIVWMCVGRTVGVPKRHHGQAGLIPCDELSVTDMAEAADAVSNAITAAWPASAQRDTVDCREP